MHSLVVIDFMLMAYNYSVVKELKAIGKLIIWLNPIAFVEINEDINDLF